MNPITKFKMIKAVVKAVRTVLLSKEVKMIPEPSEAKND